MKDKNKKTKEEDDYFNFNLKSKNINQDDYSNKFKDLFPFDYTSQKQVESKPASSHFLKTSMNIILLFQIKIKKESQSGKDYSKQTI